MVSKGLAGAAAFAMALATAGAFAPGTPFIRSPLSVSNYDVVKVESAVAESTKVRTILAQK